jgi:hypothetical protein
MTVRAAALVFAGLTLVVILFQLALALGAPWGAYAMGGAFPGVYPPAMRIAALVQIAVLALIALVVLARAGLVPPRWSPAAGILVWIVVGLLGVGVVLNLISPSPIERLIWAPVTVLLLLSTLRVALSR